MRNLKVQSSIFFLREAFSSLIFLYQRTFSPDHGPYSEFFGNARCRFFPSCSEYTRQALSQYGLFAGVVFSVKRIIKCGPWHKGGYDPLK